MKSALLLLLMIGFLFPKPAGRPGTQASPAYEEDCDDPDAAVSCCFRDMPATLSAVMEIAGPSEAGERMSVRGTLYHRDGKTPYPGVVMYAYHTDNRGHYSKDGSEKGIQKWHGRLHGWCRTDSAGRYEIRSVRPAPYPGGRIPAHIHAALLEPGKEPYYISDFVFRDDPFVTPEYIASVKGSGGKGVVSLHRTAAGWKGQRDIILEK